ncbi:hypothetical protein SAMN05216223_1174 [Actinacidiphila yanglinensis]|uniref:Uncharacterized protein n=1 Tax=Actinacidiphila yanglinensis TaxID=310779 RepID=A0A1H6DLR6_9ACTN|nr:hypothetical protein [Actinacidiphila yanglinensis]SEG86129.1 hypothetical protein SAMN05216223_1174 [Actinacidiphila yanglinensis]
MGIVSDYVFVMPGVIAAGWIVSWWGPRWIRWSLLSAAGVVSVFCAVIGLGMKSPPVTPQDPGCSPLFACTDWRPVEWIATGLLGFGCSVVLVLVTALVDVVRFYARAAA